MKDEISHKWYIWCMKIAYNKVQGWICDRCSGNKLSQCKHLSDSPSFGLRGVPDV
jgi:hypothetical protein